MLGAHIRKPQQKDRSIWQGIPVSPHAADNLKLLDEVCFIPRRTQQHELQAYLDEIIKQGIVDAKKERTAADDEGPTLPCVEGSEDSMEIGA
jgi:hypothetical protein